MSLDGSLAIGQHDDVRVHFTISAERCCSWYKQSAPGKVHGDIKVGFCLRQQPNGVCVQILKLANVRGNRGCVAGAERGTKPTWMMVHIVVAVTLMIDE
jgi:hypothetical protein